MKEQVLQHIQEATASWVKQQEMGTVQDALTLAREAGTREGVIQLVASVASIITGKDYSQPASFRIPGGVAVVPVEDMSDRRYPEGDVAVFRHKSKVAVNSDGVKGRNFPREQKDSYRYATPDEISAYVEHLSMEGVSLILENAEL